MSHIADKAGFLASLSADDPERMLAEEHVRSCGMCRDAFDEGRRLMALLAEAAPLPALSAATIERAALAIEAENSGERQARRVLGWATATSVLSAFAIQIAVGTGLARDGNGTSVALTVLALALVGALFARANRRLVVAALLLLAGLFAYSAGTAPMLAPKEGLVCTLYELGAAALAWFVAKRLMSWRGVRLNSWHGAALAAAGALSSGAAQHLTCPVSHAGPHLLVFHFGGVVIAAMLGAGGALYLPA